MAAATLLRAAALVAGVAVLAGLAASRPVDRLLTRAIRRLLRRWTDLDVRDYAGLVELAGDYAVVELPVEPQDWLADRRLADLTLRDEGVVVLGLHRDGGRYVGAPHGDPRIHPGDVLVLYGREDRVAELDRRAGDEAGERGHATAVAEQAEIEAAEDAAVAPPPPAR